MRTARATFTTLLSSSSALSTTACRVVERGGRRLLVGLVGDSLMQVGLVMGIVGTVKCNHSYHVNCKICDGQEISE